MFRVTGRVLPEAQAVGLPRRITVEWEDGQLRSRRVTVATIIEVLAEEARGEEIGLPGYSAVTEDFLAEPRNALGFLLDSVFVARTARVTGEVPSLPIPDGAVA